jgi:LL-diaminopimelate aminotransferase
MIRIEKSERLKKLPAYLFVELDKAKRAAKDEGRDIIDLGIGDPDMPTPNFIIDALAKAARDPKNHRYPLDQGLPQFRQECASFFKKRFGASLDPESEIYPLIGSKEGIAHMPLAFVNPGDHVLVPDPCYPPYKSGTYFAGGEVDIMPLKAERHFLPDLKAINHAHLHKVRMMFINYPNNPTGATCDKKFLKDVVDFAAKHNIIVVCDAAYSEMGYDGYRAPSIFEIDGARDVAIEFHSLSKTFNMTGWRLGFAVGNPDIIKALNSLKENVDSRQFPAIALAGAYALDNVSNEPTIKLIQRRRDILVDGLQSLGCDARKPKASFYVWAPVPKGYTSADFRKALLMDAGVFVIPGSGYGQYGEGYVRMSLTVSGDVNGERVAEAIRRIKEMNIDWASGQSEI